MQVEIPLTARRSLLALACGLLFMAAVCAAQSNMTNRGPNRQALSHIVHDRCIPEQEGGLAKTPDCILVDLRGGYVVIKDLKGVAQMLLIPTGPVSGIESPELLSPDAPNYFAEAWRARSYLDGPLHATLPREHVSLAINSLPSRTQDSLHIHIDCVREDVAQQLHDHENSIGDTWAPFEVPLLGHQYMAMRVDGAELTENPFKLLANGIAGARDDMGQRTLVLIGATFAGGRPGFLLLEDRASGADKAGGEELQDHECAIARAKN